MNCGKWQVAAYCFAFSAVGCSGAREVEVTGEVTAPSGSSVGEDLVLEFRDVVGEGADAESTLVRKTSLHAAKAFAETLPLEGDRLEVLAIDDRDADGTCSIGEAWARTSAPIDRDKATGVTLLLRPGCPPLDE
jgi:hypothetical protein